MPDSQKCNSQFLLTDLARFKKWPDSRNYHVIDTFVSLHQISGVLYEHLNHFQQLSPYAQARLQSTEGMRWEREQNSPARLPTGPGTMHREGWHWLGFSADPHMAVPSDSGLYLFLSLSLALDFLHCMKICTINIAQPETKKRWYTLMFIQSFIFCSAASFLSSGSLKIEPALALLNSFPRNEKTTEHSLAKLNKQADSTVKLKKKMY